MAGKHWCVFLCITAGLIVALAIASTLLGANYEWATTPLLFVFIVGFLFGKF